MLVVHVGDGCSRRFTLVTTLRCHQNLKTITVNDKLASIIAPVLTNDRPPTNSTEWSFWILDFVADKSENFDFLTIG